MSSDPEISAGRHQLMQRIRKFSLMTHDAELLSQMTRLGELVSDRDCPESVLDKCQSLYGLVGEPLKRKLADIIPMLESQLTWSRKRRDRIDAIEVTKSMYVQDQLRAFYFEMSADDLQTIWNGGENDLPDREQELVRLAIRNKLGIEPMHLSPRVCPQCSLLEKDCVCERGWR